MTPTLESRILRGPLTNAAAGAWSPKGRKALVKHLQPGVVTYDEVKDEKTGEVLQPKITYLLDLEAIARMRPTAAGIPVVGKSGGFDHAKVENGKKYDGVVLDSIWDGESGWEAFNVDELNPETAQACERGFQASCAYIPTETDGKPGLWHNVPYDEKILNGRYTHVAVVPNPRYDGATIELLNSVGGVIMNKVLKGVLSLVSRKDLREVVNALEEEDKKAASEKEALEKKNADEKASKKAALLQAYNAADAAAKTPEEKAQLKEKFEKDNAMIESGGGEGQDPAAAAPAASPAQPKADLPAAPLGGGDVLPEPGVPGEQIKDPAGAAANAAETPEQAQEREKKALEAKNAADAEAAAKKKEADEKAEKERANALELKNKAEAEAKINAERDRRFQELRNAAAERGGNVGETFVSVSTAQDRENLGRDRYGSKPQQ